MKITLMTSRSLCETDSMFTMQLLLRLTFDCSSTALRPFDDLRYDSRPTCVRAAAWRRYWSNGHFSGQPGKWSRY